MTEDKQQAFDQRFEKAVRAGMATLLIGIGLMVAVGLPALAFLGSAVPFMISTGVVILGGIIAVGSFGYDIFFSPRWKR